MLSIWTRLKSCRVVKGNPLPVIPILGSSNSAANKDNYVKHIDEWEYNFLIE